MAISARMAYTRLLTIAAETGNHEIALLAGALMRRCATLAAERSAADRRREAGVAG